MRTATITRTTKETDIKITLNLDGTGEHEIDTGLGFLDHMLRHVAVHGLFDLTVRAEGDLHIDPHHTVEDVALVLGAAFDEALGDRKGIARMGAAYVPMDETLGFVAVDLSGRPYAVTDVAWRARSPWAASPSRSSSTSSNPSPSPRGPTSTRACSTGATTTTKPRRSSRHWGGRWTPQPSSIRGGARGFHQQKDHFS